MPNDATISKNFDAGQQTSQDYQTPVRPMDTPNAQQAARSQQALAQGQELRSGGPADTPRWVQPTPGSAAQETQQAGQALHAAGIKSDNPPLSESAAARIDAALDNYRKIGQTAGQDSRLEEAAREKASAPPSPPETGKDTKHR